MGFKFPVRDSNLKEIRVTDDIKRKITRPITTDMTSFGGKKRPHIVVSPDQASMAVSVQIKTAPRTKSAVTDMVPAAIAPETQLNR
jgi:hypothetical protein